MAVYSIKDTSLIAVADAIRKKTGLVDALTLEQMAACIMALYYDGDLEVISQASNVVSDSVDGVSFGVMALGVANYDWQYGSNGTNFYSLGGYEGWTGAAENTLSLASNANVNWYYRCKLTGNDGTVMYTNVVRIVPPDAGLTIITQPADIEAGVGDTATFSVEAAGVAFYQWQVGGTNGASWTDITWEGNQTATMTQTMNETNITYVYRCKLTGYDGTVIYTNTMRFR